MHFGVRRGVVLHNHASGEWVPAAKQEEIETAAGVAALRYTWYEDHVPRYFCLWLEHRTWAIPHLTPNLTLTLGILCAYQNNTERRAKQTRNWRLIIYRGKRKAKSSVMCSVESLDKQHRISLGGSSGGSSIRSSMRPPKKEEGARAGGGSLPIFFWQTADCQSATTLS